MAKMKRTSVVRGVERNLELKDEKIKELTNELAALKLTSSTLKVENEKLERKVAVLEDYKSKFEAALTENVELENELVDLKNEIKQLGII